MIDTAPGTALRATMSLPAAFPPVQRDGRVLVDGGALDNVPADVVRAAGAAYVIAIDVGVPAQEDIDYSMFGLMGHTIDAMMRSATRAALTSADLVIAVDVKGFGSLDWRRADELIARGYAAAEAHREALLEHRLDDAAWQAWAATRDARRRTEVPAPDFLSLSGVEPGDASVVRHTLEPHLHRPIDVPLLERDLATLTGLDRYQSVTWRVIEENGRAGLLVSATPKTYAPPFLMLGLNIENTTAETFRVQLAARYLTFDLAGSGSELRVDAGVGADPTLSASFYKPLGGTHVFGRATGTVGRRTLNFVEDDVTVAEYGEQRQTALLDLGFNLRRRSEIAGGLWFAHLDDSVRAGDPGLPEISGGERGLRLHYVFDGQDSPVVPSRGARVIGLLEHTLASPEVPDATRTNTRLTQLEAQASWFRTAGRKNRVFVVASGGTSFNDHPLATKQFTVGYPYVLDAFSIGEKRGDHYGVLTLGLLRQVSRLPDFIGGPIFIGGWLENGSVFDKTADADFNTHLAVGVVMDTIVGPVLIASSTGLDGGWRTIFGIGRIFR